jgi:hypothetical protein
MKYLNLKDQVDKFQVTATDTEREPHGWSELKDSRRVIRPERKENIVKGKDAEGDLYYYDSVGINRKTGGLDDTYPLNSLPGGMDITNHERTEQNQMPLVPSYATGTERATERDANRGFKRLNMSPTDEQNEYPEFFGEAKGEDDSGDKYSGFIERRNVADRN